MSKSQKSKHESLPARLDLPGLNNNNRAPRLTTLAQTPHPTQNTQAQSPIQLQPHSIQDITNRATAHATNLFADTLGSTTSTPVVQGYGPTTSNELLPITLALDLMHTTKPMPGVLQLPKHFITNLKQYMAGTMNRGPKVQPQIRPYQANPLVHQILGTNPSIANNEYLAVWLPQYTGSDPITYNYIITLKNHWKQYNKLVQQGKKHGQTCNAVEKIIKKNFNKLSYPAQQWFLQVVDKPPYWDQQTAYIQLQQDQIREQQAQLKQKDLELQQQDFQMTQLNQQQQDKNKDKNKNKNNNKNKDKEKTSNKKKDDKNKDKDDKKQDDPNKLLQPIPMDQLHLLQKVK